MKSKISIWDCRRAIEIAGGLPLTIRGDLFAEPGPHPVGRWFPETAVHVTQLEVKQGRWVIGNIGFTRHGQEHLTKLARDIIADNERLSGIFILAAWTTPRPGTRGLQNRSFVQLAAPLWPERPDCSPKSSLPRRLPAEACSIYARTGERRGIPHLPALHPARTPRREQEWRHAPYAAVNSRDERGGKSSTAATIEPFPSS